MKTLRLETIAAGRAIYRRGDTIPEDIRSRVGREDLYETVGQYLDLLHKGPDWILEPIHHHQPRTSAIIDRARIDWILAATWVDDPVEMVRMLRLDLYLGLDNQYIGVWPHDDLGPGSLSSGRYRALPQPIADAYYSRVLGLQATNDLYAPLWESPVLPGRIDLWGDVETELAKHGIRKAQIGRLLAAMGRRSSLPGGPLEQRFRIVIDSREYLDESAEADWIIVDEAVPNSPLFHLRGTDPDSLSVLLDPVNTIDAYVAWALGGSAGRFDFQPRSQTLLSR